MIMFGPSRCIPYLYSNIDRDDLVIYNLTSYVDGYPRVDIMPPRVIYDENFEMNLLNYIINNDNAFINWMGYIVMPLYYGKTLYLITSENDMFDFFIEAVMSILRNRYGYNGYIVNDIEDLEYLDNEVPMPEGEFGILGMGALYQDKERYSYLMESLRQQGKQVYDSAII